MRSLKILSVIACMMLFFSCTQSLDFKQLDNYKIKPVVVLPLSFFTIDATNFIPGLGDSEINEVSQTLDFEILTSPIINNLEKLAFNFEISNSFNHCFTFEIKLLDSADQFIYQLDTLKVEAEDLGFIRSLAIDLIANPKVKNLKKITIKISLNDDSRPVLATDPSKMHFKSAAVFYIESLL